MTDSYVPLPQQEHSAPAAPARQAAREASTAAQKVAQRVLLLDRPRYVDAAPASLDPDHGGLVLCGKNAGSRARQLRGAGYESILVIDQAAYETEAATADEPFALPEGRLFGEDLDDVLQEQLSCGADIAVTPTRYVYPGDADALKAVMRAAQAIERSDVIVIVPVAITWLRDESLRQLMAVLKGIPHPKALILGGQYNPLDTFANAPKNLRYLAQEVADLGLWRTDLAAFDCIAYGGRFAAIGAGGSVRHLIPEDEEPQSSSFPGAHLPSVLVPDLLRFSKADWLATKYANTPPPRCPARSVTGAFSTTSTAATVRPGQRLTPTTRRPGAVGFPICSTSRVWETGRYGGGTGVKGQSRPTKPRTPVSSSRGRSGRRGYCARGRPCRYPSHPALTWRAPPPRIRRKTMGLPDVLVDLFKKQPSCSGKPSTLERAGRHQDLHIGAVRDHYADAVEARLHSKVPGVVGPLTEQHHPRAERGKPTHDLQSGSPAPGSDHRQVDR